MPCYSSDQFIKDWRYAVKQDFSTSEGNPFPYAENGKQQWDDETKKLTFKRQPHVGSASSNGKYLALGIDHVIHVLDTQSWDTIAILRGHTNKVETLSFRPGRSDVLVSSEEQVYDDLGQTEPPTIILWNIEEERSAPRLSDDHLRNASQAALSAAAERLADAGINLNKDELHRLEETIEPAISRTVSKHIAASKVTIEGRLHSAHESQIFSPSGKWMSYFPGESPGSNGDDPWDIQIVSSDDLSKGLLLKGHTDTITWTGWNPDESLFASVSWDESIRIWDATTGQQKYKFKTEGQNWAGAFSSDSTYFAATDGPSNVWIYSMADGEQHWVYKGKRSDDWRRTLAWHTTKPWLAVGGENSGELLLLDAGEKKLLQKRLFSTDACPVDKESRDMMRGFVGTMEVRFFDRGGKLAVWTFGDWSIEVYDLKEEVKWRFSRGGTEDGPNAGKWRNGQGKVTSKGGCEMVAWEDHSKGSLFLASIDFDGVRLWEVPLTS
ncbi:WD40-repeat-containing domain protein [Fusarium redolens]|uniref:WD40-repeat-containing domain protein n=1 Tax=Fusarium redolens TaxID=48865 RepID=A0A9P9GES0_FUSRE|nr:WD40-repeat-containing domain protein [Fusarium redolens]KAH7236694.1 WD40-repeat-containing domain protein [Fusarium redolens]